MSGFPVVVVESGGVAVTLSDAAAPALNSDAGLAVTIVESGGMPLNITNYNPEPYGPELWAQPAFDASTGLTLGNWTVADGIADNNFDPSFMSATALDTLDTGDYLIEGEFVDPPSGGPGSLFGVLNVQIAGVSKNIPAALGPFSTTLTVGSIGSQVIRMRESQGDPIGLTSFSVKKIL
jgi:hypothetical protein